MDCPLKYKGQTGRTFYTRYVEHAQQLGIVLIIQDIITTTINIMKRGEKGKHLNTLEKCYTYKISKNRLHMNDSRIDIYNLIFETLQELNFQLGNARNYSTTADLHTLQFTITHALGFSVFMSRILATDL
jgi:hypothetical protein